MDKKNKEEETANLDMRPAIEFILAEITRRKDEAPPGRLFNALVTTLDLLKKAGVTGIN